MRIVKAFAAVALLLGLAIGGWWLMRPQPAQGAATIPQWVRDLDDAYSAAQPSPIRLTMAGKSYDNLGRALYEAQAGETVTIMPGEYRDCGVVSTSNVTVRALVPGSVTLNGKSCEAKAALILRGDGATVEGLRFRNIRVADHNGAGVRVDKGSATIRASIFEDSENGILANAISGAAVTVERSVFRRLGFCPPDRNCAHSIYIGRIGQATIRDSLFEQGRGGHYIKLRATNVELTGNLVDDSAGRGASYLVELPNGAAGAIRGNTLVKGPGAENRCCAIVVGAEGVKQPSSVVVSDNVAVNLTDRPVIFLADVSGEARMSGNRLQGWFIERSGMTLRGKCLGCFALR